MTTHHVATDSPEMWLDHGYEQCPSPRIADFISSCGVDVYSKRMPRSKAVLRKLDRPADGDDVIITWAPGWALEVVVRLEMKPELFDPQPHQQKPRVVSLRALLRAASADRTMRDAIETIWRLSGKGGLEKYVRAYGRGGRV